MFSMNVQLTISVNYKHQAAFTETSHLSTLNNFSSACDSGICANIDTFKTPWNNLKTMHNQSVTDNSLISMIYPVSSPLTHGRNQVWNRNPKGPGGSSAQCVQLRMHPDLLQWGLLVISSQTHAE